ncbi:hydrogenase 4 subunit F [Profundibacter sp.]
MTAFALILILVVPTAGMALLALIANYRLGSTLNVLISATAFAGACLLFWAPMQAGAFFLIDSFNIYLVALNSFVGLTTSIFSASYIAHELEEGNLTPISLRFYHALYQAMMIAMSLALLTNNLGLMWVGIEIATLSTVVMVGIYRTPQAVEAAWKYFILGSVGIALAFFGTILLYLTAEGVLGEGVPAMTFSNLQENAARFDPALLSLAFVFLLVGYGTKVGLAPLHAWLPDAHAEGPTPISAVLSGLLLNVALYAVLRIKMIMAGNADTIPAGLAMMIMGLTSLIFAAVMLYRRRDIKRLFAYSSIEHMGIITFAFGMGGPLANFAGLLHMTMHSLTKSGIFFAVGHIVQAKGTQKMSGITGLAKSHPALAWALGIGVLAIAGVPPFGVFTSEFLVVTTTFARQPVLAMILALGIIVAFGALLMHLQKLLFGEPSGDSHKVKASALPMFIHFALVLLAGLWLPPILVEWFKQVAEVLG